MFDVFAKEGKAVYKNKDTCPRELKLEKKKLATYKRRLSAIRRNLLLRTLRYSGISPADALVWVVHCLLGFL